MAAGAGLGLLVAGGALGLGATAGRPGSSLAAKPRCFGKPATIVGKPKADRLIGTAKADVIVGLGGADVINGRGGNDRICGGVGGDRLQGGAGSDALDGGAGFDVCRGGERRAACEETRPPLPKGRLAPGEYVTDEFRPRFSFAVGAGWTSDRGDLPIQILLSQKPEPGTHAVYFDSISASDSVAATIARFASTAGLSADAPATATVGGAMGQRLEVTVNSAAEVRIRGLSEPYFLAPDDKARIYALGVGKKTVTILIEAPAAEFDGFLVEAEKLLATVQFG